MMIFVHDSNLLLTLILTPLFFGFAAYFTYELVDSAKWRIIITSDSITRINLAGKETLDFAAIKGFRTDQYYIHLVPNDERKKEIKISIYVEQSGLIIGWLHRTFTELDLDESAEEERKILEDQAHGFNRETREHRLAEARRYAKYLNILGFGIGLWVLLYPTPYLTSVFASMTIPVLALGLVYFYRGLIRVDERKNSPYPSILYGVVSPSSALTLRAMFDYDFLEYNNLWIVVSVITIALTVLFLFGTKEMNFSKWVDYLNATVLAGITLSFVYGTFVVLNCKLDKSEPQIFSTSVVDKDVSSGNSTTYYLVLDPWGPRKAAEKASVTRNEYETTEKGDTVDVYLKNGLFGSSWFYVVTE